MDILKQELVIGIIHKAVEAKERGGSERYDI
jgi:hypothetical protein